MIEIILFPQYRIKLWRQVILVPAAARLSFNNSPWRLQRTQLQGDQSPRFADAQCLFIHFFHFFRRTNTYPKIPDRYRFTNDGKSPVINQQQCKPAKPSNAPGSQMMSRHPLNGSGNQHLDAHQVQLKHSMQNVSPHQSSEQKIDRTQEEIYFWYQLEVEI